MSDQITYVMLIYCIILLHSGFESPVVHHLFSKSSKLWWLFSSSLEMSGGLSLHFNLWFCLSFSSNFSLNLLFSFSFGFGGNFSFCESFSLNCSFLGLFGFSWGLGFSFSVNFICSLENTPFFTSGFLSLFVRFLWVLHVLIKRSIKWWVTNLSPSSIIWVRVLSFASCWNTNWIIFQMNISFSSSQVEFSFRSWYDPFSGIILIWVPVNTKSFFLLFHVSLSGYNILIDSKIWDWITSWVIWFLLERVLEFNTASWATNWITVKMNISLSTSEMEFSFSSRNFPCTIFVLSWIPINTEFTFGSSSMSLSRDNVFINSKIWDWITSWVIWLLLEWVLEFSTATCSTNWIRFLVNISAGSKSWSLWWFG